MVLYYTGTGNSRYAAEMIAALTQDTAENAGVLMQKGLTPELASEKPFVFSGPTYCYRIPRVFESFLRGCTFSGSRKAYFVMTCGSSVGDATRYLKKLCAQMGLDFMGLCPVVMPENYMAMYGVPDEERALGIIRAAEPAIADAAARIASGESLPPVKVGLGGFLTSTVINPLFYAFIVHDRAFSVSDACTGCGECARGCAANNITLQDGKPVWGGACTHCMACICTCPVRAIEYGRHSRNQPQYRCPPYGGV